jgi:hypothetical protein
MSATTFGDSRQIILMAKGCNQHSRSSSKVAFKSWIEIITAKKTILSAPRRTISRRDARVRRIILNRAAIDLHPLCEMEIK